MQLFSYRSCFSFHFLGFWFVRRLQTWSDTVQRMRDRAAVEELEVVKWVRCKIVVCDSASALFPANTVDARAAAPRNFLLPICFPFHSQFCLLFRYRWFGSTAWRCSMHKMRINNCIMMAWPLIYCATKGTYTRARALTQARAGRWQCSPTKHLPNLHGKRGAVLHTRRTEPGNGSKYAHKNIYRSFLSFPCV